MKTIQSVLSNLCIGEAQVHGCLAVYPLSQPVNSRMNYVLLDEALERDIARVTEISQAGSVPELSFVNNSEQDVLLVDGDELVGARQNRIVNITILVGAGKEIVIPVSCVEQGRWAYSSSRFQAARRTLFASAKARKMRAVSSSLRDQGARNSNQGEVWEAIHDRLQFNRVESDTAAMGDLYSGLEPELSDYDHAFQVRPSQSGAVFAVGGKVIGFEFFDAPEAFARCFPKMIRSYAIEAREAPGVGDTTESLESVRRFLDDMVSAALESYPALGEGMDVRLTGSNLSGGALVDKDRVIHLAAYRVEAAPIE